MTERLYLKLAKKLRTKSPNDVRQSVVDHWELELAEGQVDGRRLLKSPGASA